MRSFIVQDQENQQKSGNQDSKQVFVRQMTMQSLKNNTNHYGSLAQNSQQNKLLIVN